MYQRGLVIQIHHLQATYIRSTGLSETVNLGWRVCLQITRGHELSVTVPPAISDLATQIIDDYYLKRNGLSVRQCYQIFVDVFGERSSNNKDDLFGEKCPSQATFYNWINQLPYLDVVASREGKRAATKYKRKCLKKFKLDNILDRVEIDAAHFNIGLKDDEGNYLGPALVYVAIDCYSRAILGYYIQVGGGESADGVAKCIFSILGDKNESGIKTTNRWVMFGSPLTLVSDAGPAFISKQIQGLFEFLENTTPITTESGQPWKKPFIERWFGTVRTQLLSTLPGYVGKRTDQKELSISMRKSASLTLKEFEEVFVQYIVDDYHQARHSGLDNLTPYEAWIEGARSAPPMAIHNLDRLKEFRGEHQSRMLQRTGITVNNVSYYSEELHAAALQLPSAFPHEADVYFNKEDIGQITVRLLNGETFNVPAKVDFEHLSGMRLHEYKVLRAKQKADAEVRREMVHEFAGGKRVPVAISYAKENKGKNFDESFKKTPSFNPKAVAKEAEMLSYHMNNPEQLSERPDTATNSGIEPYSSDSGFLSDDFFKEEPDTLEDI